MAKARSRGIAANMAVPTVDSSALTCCSVGALREIETALDSRSEGVETGCIDRLASICHATPAPSFVSRHSKKRLAGSCGNCCLIAQITVTACCCPACAGVSPRALEIVRSPPTRPLSAAARRLRSMGLESDHLGSGVAAGLNDSLHLRAISRRRSNKRRSCNRG